MRLATAPEVCERRRTCCKGDRGCARNHEHQDQGPEARPHQERHADRVEEVQQQGAQRKDAGQGPAPVPAAAPVEHEDDGHGTRHVEATVQRMGEIGVRQHAGHEPVGRGSDKHQDQQHQRPHLAEQRLHVAHSVGLNPRARHDETELEEAVDPHEEEEHEARRDAGDLPGKRGGPELQDRHQSAPIVRDAQEEPGRALAR
mmetsp:Transcript_27711/g.88088  ORF Transcript_27711/g.88088 Transcript_27711/m.88088 type:complete len:201 (+) Transcript_27711:102-704(+)